MASTFDEWPAWPCSAAPALPPVSGGSNATSRHTLSGRATTAARPVSRLPPSRRTVDLVAGGVDAGHDVPAADVETAGQRIDERPGAADERQPDLGPASVDGVAVVDGVEDEREERQLRRAPATHRGGEGQHRVRRRRRDGLRREPVGDGDVEVREPLKSRIPVAIGEPSPDRREGIVEGSERIVQAGVPAQALLALVIRDEDADARFAVRAHPEAIPLDLGRDRRLSLRMDPGATELDIDVRSGERRRPHPPAEPVARLEDDDVPSGLGQVAGRDEAGQPAADHQDIGIRHVPLRCVSATVADVRSIYRPPWRIDVEVRPAVRVPVSIASLARAVATALDAAREAGAATAPRRSA